MKEELRKILEQYEAIQKKHENKLTSCRQMIKAKDAELRTLCADLKTYRENEEAAKAISEEIKNARDTAEELTLAIMINKESKIDTAAHALIDAIKADPEKWQKYPTHYKKFEELVTDTVGNGFFVNDRYGLGSYYLYTKEMGNENNYYIFHTRAGQIDKTTLEEMESKIESYCEVPPAEALKEAKRIIKTRAAILDKINKAKADIDNLRKGFNGSSAYNYLPYISKIENDGSIFIR